MCYVLYICDMCHMICYITCGVCRRKPSKLDVHRRASCLDRKIRMRKLDSNFKSWENIYIISYLYSHPACGYSYTKHAHIAILTYYYKMAIVARACSMPFGTRVNKRQGIHFWHRFSTGIPASSSKSASVDSANIANDGIIHNIFVHQ